MTDLSKLRQAVEHQLGGLTATSVMMNEIRKKASDKSVKPATFAWRKPVTAIALCAVCALLVFVLLPKPSDSENKSIVLTPEKSLTQSHHAGEAAEKTEGETSSTVSLVGQVSLQTGSDPMQNTLFDGRLDGDFSMLIVNGKVYRLLTSPKSVAHEDFGKYIDAVDEYNTTPSLATGNCVSNVLQIGEGIYQTSDAIPGLIVAECNGIPRLWQRACYAGKAIKNGETLTDTLCAADQVESIEWLNHGCVSDEDAQQLFALLSISDYIDANAYSGDSVLIHMKNGFMLQLLMNGDTLCSCGTWNSTAFTEALHQMLP